MYLFELLLDSFDLVSQGEAVQSCAQPVSFQIGQVQGIIQYFCIASFLVSSSEISAHESSGPFKLCTTSHIVCADMCSSHCSLTLRCVHLANCYSNGKGLKYIG